MRIRPFTLARSCIIACNLIRYKKNPRDGVHSDACTDLPSRRHEANKIKWILRRLLHYSGPEREERVDLTPLGRTGVVAYCWMGGPPMEQGGTGER